jgi:hypothetical protein
MGPLVLHMLGVDRSGIYQRSDGWAPIQYTQMRVGLGAVRGSCVSKMAGGYSILILSSLA